MPAKKLIEKLVEEFEQSAREALSRNGWGMAWAMDAAPWSIEGLGPERTHGVDLARLDSEVLRDGRCRSLSDDGHPIHWHTKRVALFELFLGALRGSDGVTWRDWISAFEGFWGTGFFLCPAQPEDELAEDPWDRDLALARKGLTNIADDALERSWHEAFASGRILVFAEERGGFVLQAPHVWSVSPPFPCPSLEDIRDRFLRESARNRAAAENNSDLAKALSLGLPGFSDEAFSKLKDELSAIDRIGSSMNSIRGPEPRGALGKPWFHGGGGRRTPGDHRKLAFLLSCELGHFFENAGHGDAIRQGGPGGRDRVVEINELIEWFAAGIDGGENWNRRKREALRAIQAEARRRNMVFATSRNAAVEVWDRTVPSAWKAGGSPKPSN